MSEVEASINPSEDIRSNLKERRKNRKACSCPPEYRSEDTLCVLLSDVMMAPYLHMTSYDTATDLLFDDRVEQIIIHGADVRPQLTDKRPDRVFGLRVTKAFEKVFNALEDDDYLARQSLRRV